MLRHYLPSIAALIALIIVIFFFPFGERADRFGKKFELKAEVAGAQSFCGVEKVDVKLTVELEYLTPTFKPYPTNGENRLCAGCPDTYNPPLVVNRVEACCGSCSFDLHYKSSVVFDWNTQYAGQCAHRFNDVKVDRISRGDKLFNAWINNYDASWTQYTKGKETIEHMFTQVGDGANSDKSIVLKDIPQISSKFSSNTTDSKTKVLYDAKVFISSGNAKGGLDGVDSTTNTTGGDLSDLREGNFNKTMTICKDTNQNRICDSKECQQAKQCQDGKDNDGDGKTDLADPGCRGSATNDLEANDPVCNDGKDNDDDGKIDMNDPGCSSDTDGSEGNPQCSDGADNDHDEKIDMKDRGCSSEKDDNEGDEPPIDRSVTLKKTARPVFNFQPLPEKDELIKFKTDCKDCTIETSKDPKEYLGGLPAAKENFIIIGTLVAADKTLSHTVVAVGEYREEKILFSKKTGNQYENIGDDPETQYIPGILLNQENDYVFKVKVGNNFEILKPGIEVLPSTKDEKPKNGDIAFVLVTAKDSEQTERIMLLQARVWDQATMTDKGDQQQCASKVPLLPKFQNFLSQVRGFQHLLEFLSLCQRK